MVKEVQSWFETSDGMKLYSKTWEPDTTPRAYLVFIHGFSDRCEVHYALFPTLASSGIQTHSFDQRGWGKSVHKPSQKGLTGSTTTVLSDINEFISHVAAGVDDTTARPLFLMGHSMGGQQVLHYSLTTLPIPDISATRSKLSGLIVEAPYIGLHPSAEPSSLVVLAGKAAARILPSFQLKQKLDAKWITRDPDINKAWAEDELCHDTTTLEGAKDMLQRAADLLTLSSSSPSSSGASAVPKGLSLTAQLPYPTLWTHGTDDKVTIFPPSKALYERLAGPDPSKVPDQVQGKEFKAYQGAYHKIHCEPDGVGQAFARDVAEWIIKIVDGKARIGKGQQGDAPAATATATATRAATGGSAADPDAATTSVDQGVDAKL